MMPTAPPIPTPLRVAFDRLNAAIDTCCERNGLLPKLDSFPSDSLRQGL